MTDLTPAAQALLDSAFCSECPEWGQYRKKAHPVTLGDLGTHQWTPFPPVTALLKVEAEARASAEAERLTVERLDAALGKAWGHILRMTDYNESRAEVAAAILTALAAPPAEPRE